MCSFSVIKLICCFDIDCIGIKTWGRWWYRSTYDGLNRWVVWWLIIMTRLCVKWFLTLSWERIFLVVVYLLCLYPLSIVGWYRLLLRFVDMYHCLGWIHYYWRCVDKYLNVVHYFKIWGEIIFRVGNIWLTCSLEGV